MASFSPATRELVLKLVYYGPGLGGKTTSLRALHAAVRAEHRGKMISLATPVDRTLYFDFLPVRLPSVGDVQLRLQLFTVPGQVYFNATRKLVLTGADGIVFVADSQAVRLDANTESLNNLRENLQELGRPFETVPIVLAYNKRDLPDVLGVDELDRELNPHGFPSLPTSASTGGGVFETLDAVVRLALDDLIRRRVIPSDVQVPSGGVISERLVEVRAEEPSQEEPTRIVTGGANIRATPARGIELPATPTMVPPAPLNPVASVGAVPFPSSLASLQHTAQPAPAAPAPTPSGPRPTLSSASLPAWPGVGSPGKKGTTFSALFDAEDQETVRTIEDALAEGLHPRALLLLEALLLRLLERAARAQGRTEASQEALAWTLGLPPERYARLRVAAQRVRNGVEVPRKDVLEAYLFVAFAQLGLEALSR